MKNREGNLREEHIQNKIFFSLFPGVYRKNLGTSFDYLEGVRYFTKTTLEERKNEDSEIEKEIGRSSL